MTLARIGIFLSLSFAVSACSNVEPATRSIADAGMGSVGSSDNASASITPVVAGQARVKVKSVNVTVPRSLKVSESNSYLPSGDIVWREDPIGDRHAQVQAIVQNALDTGVASLNGPVPVRLDIEVVKFHALTEKARYTTGGVHAITFNMSIRDAESGELLAPVRKVRADLDAFGGAQALRAEANGQTQKVRISNHLAEVIRQELSDPRGHRPQKKGLIGALNYL